MELELPIVCRPAHHPFSFHLLIWRNFDLSGFNGAYTIDSAILVRSAKRFLVFGRLIYKADRFDKSGSAQVSLADSEEKLLQSSTKTPKNEFSFCSFLLGQGIHNFWIDQADGGALGEAWENNGQSTLIESIPYSRPFTLYATGTQESAGKMYPWSHQMAIEEGLRNMTNMHPDDPQCQYVSLSRSTHIGGQRFCSLVWSGDTTSVWPTLQEQITTGLSQAATSIAWWTVDIGGFQVDPTVPWSGNIDRSEYRELFVRWFQWGTFIPFMRVHGSRACDFQNAYTCNNEPWSYGAANLAIIKSYIELRYQLKPYLTSIFKALHESGRMIMRPLFIDFTHSDSNIPKWTRINDEGLAGNFTTQQYMFGPRLLVIPVTLPNVTTWKVYLPKTRGETGDTKPWTFWYVRSKLNDELELTQRTIVLVIRNRWSNETYAGGQIVEVPSPIEHIPLFHLGSRDDIMSGDVF